MTQKETAGVLSILRAAYPNTYKNLTPTMLEDMLAVWQTIFSDEDAAIVAAAVRKLITTHSGFPPDIAAVMSCIDEIDSCLRGDPDDEELWRLYRSALSNGIYGFREEYAALPEILQRYAGNPGTIRELAMMSEEYTDTVLKDRFLKAIPRLRERMRGENRMAGLPDGSPASMTEAQRAERRERFLTALGVRPAPAAVGNASKSAISEGRDKR